MAELLHFSALMARKAAAVKRYLKNPHVQGDNVAEHEALGIRYLMLLIPELKQEFPTEKDLEFSLLATFMVHDDDEVIAGGDIATFIKKHNANDTQEIADFNAIYSKYLGKPAVNFIHFFKDFRGKSTLTAKLCKITDNLVGNQLALEDKIGLLNPHYYILCAQYVTKYLGISKIMDREIRQQVRAMQMIRKEFIKKKYYLPYKQAFLEHGFTNETEICDHIHKLLSIDLGTITQPEPKLAYTAVWEYTF